MPGKPLHPQARELVLRLLEYFQREKDNGGPLKPLVCVQERVSEALQVSEATLKRIVSDKKNGIIPKTTIRRNRLRSKTIDMDDTKKCEIRDCLYDMYSKKQHVSLNSLNEELKTKNIVHIGKTSLSAVLKTTGFSFKKDDNRRALCEKSHVKEMRATFLREYIDNINETIKYKCVYLDETWIYSKGTARRSWQDSNVLSVKRPEASSDGKRYMILHAGTEDGWVSDASLIFSAKSKSADYHDNMDADRFETWLEHQLIPSLDEPSMVILDNASYHSRRVEQQPTANWSKFALQTWLDKEKIFYPPHALKNELVHLSRLNKKQNVYVVDNLLALHGHKVLRLPPYHCHFNPIELVWGISKVEFDKNICATNSTEESVLSTWSAALNKVTPAMWCKTIKHTDDIIREWWNREVAIEGLDPIIINVGDDDSDSDASTEELD